MRDILGEQLVELQAEGLEPSTPEAGFAPSRRTSSRRLAAWYREQTGLSPWTSQAQREIRAIEEKLREWGLNEEEARIETNSDPRWNGRPERPLKERKAALVGRDEAGCRCCADTFRWLVPGKSRGGVA